MNERIEELAERADKLSVQYANENNVNCIEAFNTVFAELIVEECVSQCWSVSELEYKGFVVSECSKRMRKHFGIDF